MHNQEINCSSIYLFGQNKIFITREWKEQGINKEERKDFKKQLRKTKILSVPRVSLIFTFMWF